MSADVSRSHVTLKSTSSGRGGGYGTKPTAIKIVKAVEEGDIGTVRRLLKGGTDPNTAGRNGAPLLHIAAENSKDNVELVELLIEAGAAVDALAPRATETGFNAHLVPALVVASRCSNKGVVEALLKHGADVNVASEVSGTTALIEAAGRRSTDGTLDIIKLLVKQGADVNAQDLAMPPGFGGKRGGKGFSPLMAAVANGNYELIQFLLQNGADANAKDDYRGNALTIVAGCNVLVPGNHVKTGELLLAFGAVVDATNHYEMTSLMCAMVKQHPVAEFLIQHGPDPNLRDKYGCTALFYAVEYDRFDMMSTLVGELGATVNTWGNPKLCDRRPAFGLPTTPKTPIGQRGALFAKTTPRTPIDHAASKAKDHMVRGLLQLSVVETEKMWL